MGSCCATPGRPVVPPPPEIESPPPLRRAPLPLPLNLLTYGLANHITPLTPGGTPSPTNQEEAGRDLLPPSSEGTGDYCDVLLAGPRPEAQLYPGLTFQASVAQSAAYSRLSAQHQAQAGGGGGGGGVPFYLPQGLGEQEPGLGLGLGVGPFLSGQAGSHGAAGALGNTAYTYPGTQMVQSIQGMVPSYPSLPWADYGPVPAPFGQSLCPYPGLQGEGALYPGVPGTLPQRYAFGLCTQAAQPVRPPVPSCADLLAGVDSESGTREETESGRFPEDLSH